MKNTGNTPTAFNQWPDGLYLSADTNWNKATDIFVKDVLHKSALAPSASYSDQQEFVIPEGLSGKYYVLLVADHNDQNRDSDKKNNRRLIMKNNVDTAKIQVTLAPPADLAIAAFTCAGIHGGRATGNRSPGRSPIPGMELQRLHHGQINCISRKIK